jgi:hypothetical protein
MSLEIKSSDSRSPYSSLQCPGPIAICVMRPSSCIIIMSYLPNFPICDTIINTPKSKNMALLTHLNWSLFPRVWNILEMSTIVTSKREYENLALRKFFNLTQNASALESYHILVGALFTRSQKLLFTLLDCFLFHERLHCCYIYFHGLESCALNAEFWHFILRFNKIFFTLVIPLKSGIGGWKQALREGDFKDNPNIQWLNFVKN